jgi:flagellar hook-associated protein 1 FlgK
MGLTASFNTARAGLGLVARRAEVIAANVSRADEPGYVQRRITPGERPGIVAVQRMIDPALQQMRRDAAADAAKAEIGRGFALRLDELAGDPDRPGSLLDHLARFEAALTTVASDPTSNAGLTVAVDALGAAVGKLNALGRHIATARQDAENRIAATVDGLNRDLEAVDGLNADIRRLGALGRDTSDLLDRRALKIDSIAEAVPVRPLARDDGTVALVTKGGAILLDGVAAPIGFSPRQSIQPSHAHPADLSGLTLRDRPAGTGLAGEPFAGGTLAALFELRDAGAPRGMAQLDAVAQELATRLQESDATVTAPRSGPLTDGGARVAAIPEPGLAIRLQVDPRLGGDGVRLLRDGMDAPVATHRNDQLLDHLDALAEVSTPRSDALGGGAADMTSLAGRFHSAVSTQRLVAVDLADGARGEANRLRDLRDGGAVDIDAEMQRLLRVEQAYAANARLIQAVGQMMDRITEI